MLEVRRNPRPARLAFPTPEQLEALAVPTDEGFGRHDDQCAAPIEPAAEPQEIQAFWMGDPVGPDSAFLVEASCLRRKRFSAASELLDRKPRIKKQSKSAKRFSQSRQNFITDQYPWFSLLLPSNWSQFSPFQVSPVIFAEDNLSHGRAAATNEGKLRILSTVKCTLEPLEIVIQDNPGPLTAGR